MIDREAIEKLEELVQAAVAPQVPPVATAKDPQPYVIVRNGYELKYPKQPDKPNRIAQKVALHDAASFVDYVSGHKQQTSAIFFDEDPKTFTAILDYHQEAKGTCLGANPEWCEHVATFVARTTPEWNTWFGSNKKAFGQVEFAEFLEDNLIDVVDPDGASLLEITRTLEAKKDVSYSSAIRLNNGSVRINFDEVIKGTANTQAGIIEIPEQFMLQLQVIRGGSAYKFPARFKYRLKDRALVLWYEIVRPHKVLDQALAEAVAAIQADTGITIRKGVATLTQK